jgi:hypothetical protein
MWPAGPILETGRTLGPVPADPLVGRRPADPELFGDRRRRPTIDEDALDEELAAEDAEARLRMSHESLRTVRILTNPNRAARLSLVNEVFAHHT